MSKPFAECRSAAIDPTTSIGKFVPKRRIFPEHREISLFGLGLRLFPDYFALSGPVDCHDCFLRDHHYHHLEEEFAEY